MDYLILLAIIIINTVVTQVSLRYGYEVAGQVQGATVDTVTNPGLLGVLDWAWDSMAFMWNMLSFQVDGMPAALTSVFVVMQLMMIFIVIKLIRGS